MNEEQLLNNYLLLLKSTVEVYIHGTLESSHHPVRKTLQDCLITTIDRQEKAYQKMVEKSWYTVENIPTKEIKKVLTKIQK